MTRPSEAEKSSNLRRQPQSFLIFLLASSLIFLLLNGRAEGSEEPPQWLRQVASANLPIYDKKVPAVVLLDEQQVTVDDNLRVTTDSRHAVRLLSREGRTAAVAREIYRTDTGKVRELHAWLIRPSGEVKRYGKDRAFDVALVNNDIYNEVRVKLIAAGDDADSGAVFGYESSTEDRSIFTQFEWQFQGRLPTLLSRCALTLPKTWQAESVIFNHAKVDPTISGTTYSWQLQNLPYIEEEPASPPVTSLAPRLAVTYFPSAVTRTAGTQTFTSWAAVSRWLSELNDAQTALSDTLVAKARALTAESKTELERIQVIGRYVQSVNYISIQTGLGRGGGYRAHPVVEVFGKAYGDCKDKANLMRAMLKALNISAYLVVIYSGDPFYVREEWPSPQQFNHCIIAIKVSEEAQAATVLQHPLLGRLLIFDPTDEHTPVGDLPEHEQGSLALVVAADARGLMRMPSTPPEVNQLKRQVDAVITSDGALTASIREQAAGQAAVRLRRELKALSRQEYFEMIERWVTRGVAGASVVKLEPSDEREEGRFRLELEIKAARYAQLMQERLLVFKPAIVSRRDSLFLTEPTRKYPVVLSPNAYTETVRVKLPDGFALDELPDALSLEAPFGTYAANYEVKDQHLVFTRSLTMQAASIPVEQYAAVRSFFERIRATEQSPVVLARK
jgi:Domain of Unknown Function with PDB structure (DUF3857)/Transglutaminase-like superfamily